MITNTMTSTAGHRHTERKCCLWSCVYVFVYVCVTTGVLLSCHAARHCCQSTIEDKGGRNFTSTHMHARTVHVGRVAVPQVEIASQERLELTGSGRRR